MGFLQVEACRGRRIVRQSKGENSISEPVRYSLLLAFNSYRFFKHIGSEGLRGVLCVSCREIRIFSIFL